MKQIRPALLAITVLLGGCDSAFRVKGVAPTEGCTVKVIDQERQSVFESFPVSGAFTETIVVGGIWLPDFTIQAECGGRIVRSVKNITGSYENYERPVDLGTIEP
jgi:hypothetical protein